MGRGEGGGGHARKHKALMFDVTQNDRGKKMLKRIIVIRRESNVDIMKYDNIYHT